jgi:hypothetical protein
MEFSYYPINPFQNDELSKEDRAIINAARNAAYACGCRYEDAEYAIYQALKRMNRCNLLSSLNKAGSEEE